MWESGQRLFLAALKSTLGQAVILVVPLLLFGWLIHLCSNFLEKSAVRLLGLKAYLYLIAWPGTMIHELGHAIFCPFFGHRITDMRFFSFSMRKNAGYVCHSYSGRNPYHLMGNFFISVGPLILGSVVIFFSLRFVAGLPLSWSDMIEGGKSIAPAGNLTGGLVQFFSFLQTMAAKIYKSVDWTGWRTYLAAYLILSIGSGMTLSRQDISTASSGLGVILLVLFGMNLLLAVFGIAAPDAAPLVPWAASGCLILLLVLFFCTLAALVLRLLLTLTGR